MFEQSMIPNRAKTGRAWSVVVGFLGQVAVVGVAVLVPLVAFDKLPMAKLTPLVYAPPPPPAPPMRERSVEIVDVVRERGPRAFVAPTRIPHGVSRVAPEPPREELPIGSYVPYSIGSGDATDGHNIWARNMLSVPPPKPPVEVAPKPPEPVAAKPKPVPVGGQVMLAKLVHQVKPEYPRMAKDSRIQGTVNLQAVIGRDGRIRELQVMNGHPLLVKAAMDAVRQWEYQPTTLNGQPVEVITTVEVKFILQQ